MRLLRHVRPIRLSAVVIRLLFYLISAEFTVNVKRSILLLHRLDVLVLESIWINGHLIVEHIYISLPSLLVLVKICQELLVVSVALAHLLLPLVVVVIGTLADVTLVIDVEVALKSLHVDNLALALLADIIVSVVEESLMIFQVMFAPSFFFEALVNQLSQLDQGVLDALGVLIDLTLCIYCDVRCVSSASMAQIVLSKLSAPALKRVLALRCTLGLHVVFHGGREVKVVLACTTSMHLSRINCLSSHVLRLTKV